MSDDARARQALALFDTALDLEGGERERWLVEQCAGDANLEREVRELLAAAERTLGVLDVAPQSDTLPGLSESLALALGHSYDIVREIGRGGMSTVFLAHERKHDRDVVIKVLDPSIAHLFGAERFHREVRIAATLAHPNIVPLIDSGDADGFLYYVMPFMEGESLRARLRRGAVTVQASVAILRDVAGALAFAHQAGVVHRDLKPENVLLTAGHAYLLDFGIAKLLDDSSAATSITMPGFPIGTRRYMAPEQAFAAPNVDARADIYAWGVLGLELLIGEPLPAEQVPAFAQSQLASRNDVPPALLELLVECIAPRPDERPSDMDTIAQRLDGIAIASGSTQLTTPRSTPSVATGIAESVLAPSPRSRSTLLVGAVAVVAAAAAIFAWKGGNAVAEPTSGMMEPVAVSVLRNETGDSSLAVIGRYAGDWVTDALQRIGGVQVVPWSEALTASEHAASTRSPLVATMRDELKAGTVVTGAMYRVRDSLQLQAQLIDARSGRPVSTLVPIIVPISRPDEAVAQLRDRVMGAVAAARDERVATLPGITRNPPSFSAYQAFDNGFDRFLAQRYSEALSDFREAFRRDTTFTVALLLGARAAWNADSFAVAESLVTRVRAQGRNLGAYNESSLRYIEALVQGEGAKARAAIQRAAAMAPNSRAGFDLAASMMNAGYARTALQQLQRMDPDRGEMRGWSSYWTQRAHAAYLLGDNAGQREAAQQMARRYPDRRVALVLLSRALATAGDTRTLDSALVAWESLPANVYWSQGAAMVVAGEELMRRGRTAEGKRYSERAMQWLSNRLVATPADRAHRYWLGSALYDLERYDEARIYFEGLARDFPDRLRYRGLAALTAARRGDRAGAEEWLGTATPRDTGLLLLYRARIAAILGDRENAITTLTTAVEHGVEGYAWLPGSAFRDFAGIVQDPRGKALLTGR